MNQRDQTSGSDVEPRLVDLASGGFITTHWSVVLQAGQEGSPESASALERLCCTYWYPLYAYARRQGYSPPDGQDLTQQFFAVFLEKKHFGRADPGRGRFRSFLLASFKHFLANEYHRSRTVKRGGQHSIISWDARSGESRYLREPSHDLTPEKIFERAWALTVIETALEQLRKAYADAGKSELFLAIQSYLSGDDSTQTYATVAASLNMTEGAVKMAVVRLRSHFRGLLRSEIAQTVAEVTEPEEELRHLFACLAM